MLFAQAPEEPPYQWWSAQGWKSSMIEETSSKNIKIVWVVVSTVFYFHPDPWGDDPI